MTRANVFLLFVISVWHSALPAADFTPEQGEVLRLNSDTSPHWVWVTDISYPVFFPGRAHLIDAAAGAVLGSITMGVGLTPLGLPTSGDAIYSIEMHYARSTRGDRTDVVAIYDPSTLSLKSEIRIPAKKVSGVPMTSFAGLTDDDRFLLIYNFTPAQSVTVVDLDQHQVAGEIDTPGCGLVFPSGDRSFAMLCSDGRLVDIAIDDTGAESARQVVKAMFNPKREFLTEKAVRWRDSWVFVTNQGEIRIVDFSNKDLVVSATWSLFTDDERQAGWRIGGQQHLALHNGEGLLFATVHQGTVDSHKDPGSHVFVYDVSSGKRQNKITLARPASSINVTQDKAPLLLATNAYPAILDVYDARSGQFQRAVEDVAVSPMLLQTPISK